MKKIGNKVLLMIAVFVVIFGINTAVSVRTQKSVKLAGARITEQYIPIQTEIFNIQKSMERGQKYLNIISLYDDDDLRQQLETSLADEITTIAESEKSISAYLEKMDQTDLADKIKNYEEFLDSVIEQFNVIQGYVDSGDFAQANMALSVDFQNLVKEEGEPAETALTKSLEQGISDLSEQYNKSVQTNLLMTKILFSFFIVVATVVIFIMRKTVSRPAHEASSQLSEIIENINNNNRILTVQGLNNIETKIIANNNSHNEKILQAINDIYLYTQMDKSVLNHFSNIPISSILQDRIIEVDAYIKDEKRDVYILDSEAAVYMIPLDKYNILVFISKIAFIKFSNFSLGFVSNSILLTASIVNR